MRRVVITGVGLVSPLGNNVSSSWDNLIQHRSGITSTSFHDLPCQVIANVDIDLMEYTHVLESREHKRMDKFIIYSLLAAHEAIAHARLDELPIATRSKIGVILGSGIGGLPHIYDNSIALSEKGRVSPFFIPSSLINLACGQIAIKHKFHGPNFALVSACASATHAIGESARMIQHGYADIILSGGTESTVSKIGIAGFCALKALSTSFNDQPTQASRPWDKARDGFVMGEGSGILILEEYEHAKRRGANILAEVTGYGASCDAFHITAPDEQGIGAILAMQQAIQQFARPSSEINYLNAHGTSTPLGDMVELRAIESVFGKHSYKLPISSTKSATGHLLGAAGAIESIFSIFSIHNNIAPATLNLHDAEEEAKKFNLVANVAQKHNIDHVLSNSFGFGGTNACLIFSRI